MVMDSQNNYEQLKRRNRRRLVGALVMVIVAGVVLLTVMNRRPQKPMPMPEVNMSASGAAASAVAASQPAAQIEDVPLAASASMASAAGTVASGQSLAAEPTSAVIPAPVAASGEKKEKKAAVLPEQATKPVAVEQNNVSHPPVKEEKAKPLLVKPEAKPEPMAEKKPVQPAKPVQAMVKETANKPLETVHSEVKVKPEVVNTKKTVTKVTVVPVNKSEPEPVKKTADNKAKTSVPSRPAVNTGLTPQQILDNKAADAVVQKTPAKPAAANAVAGKVLIQVGAYTTEDQAKVVQQKLSGAGVPVMVTPSQTSKGTLYRVRTGTFSDRTLAQQQLNKMRSVGIDGLMIMQ